jgi:PAS domain S-box-containing protein
MHYPILPNDEADSSLPPPASGPLDATTQACLDHITRLAAQALAMPAALFAYVGADGQQLQSCYADPLSPASSQSRSFADAIGADPQVAIPPGALENHGVQVCAEAPVRRPDGQQAGTLSVLDVHPHPLDDRQRAMLADFAALLERELAAAALRHRHYHQQDKETAARALFDSMPEGVMMLSETGIILACNAVAEAMYGAAKNGLVGRNSSEFVGEDPARLNASLAAGITDQLQALARRVDGSIFPAEFSIKVLQASGAYRYSLAVRDVSARRAEEQKAQAADARRRKYFVIATHELRTPMASILGFSELLLKHDFDPEEGSYLIQVIHRQATRLVRLINEMLDLARIEASGTDELDICPQDAAAILEQTLRGLDGLHASSRIRTRLAPALPQVLADGMKLQQALTNIIGNAIKYSNADSDIHIDVFETRVGTRLMAGYRVIDKGIGMTPEQQAQVFDPFYRAHNDQDTAGTGLGMTIFKEIVELHKGLVKIASSLGVGTEVVLLLPAVTEGH